jgi:hypothetical protein
MLVLDPPERGPSSVYEEPPPRAIPACTDPQQTPLGPGGVLTWDKPQPRRKRPAMLDMRRIVDRGDEGGGREGADAQNREETWADRMRLTHGFQLPMVTVVKSQRGAAHREYPPRMLGSCDGPARAASDGHPDQLFPVVPPFSHAFVAR